MVLCVRIYYGVINIRDSSHTHFAFADPLIESPLRTDFNIQSNGDSSGYIVCDPNCHMATNSNTNTSTNSNSNSSDSEAQPARIGNKIRN
ncbi:MAG: hypothetical protein WA364_11615 [Candidatus Nitrosopolaris sp.]